MTQGSTLRLFHDLAKNLTASGKIDKAGFYVTDSKFYETYTSSQPSFAADNPEILKEWEILRAAAEKTADAATLGVLENRLGDPTLWNAIIADRRLYFGPRSMREQDYVSRYSHDHRISIISRNF